MINKLSTLITDNLLKAGNISYEEKDLYIYGLFMFFSSTVYFILSGVFGFIFNCLLESYIFFFSFQIIRKYAGGYHASTESRCEIMSTVAILLCIVLIKISKFYDFNLILLCLAVLSTVLIAVISPLDTPEKPLSEKEFCYFRRKSLIILFIIMSTVVISCYLKFYIIFAPCCMSLILESVLLIAGKIKRTLQNKQMIQ